MVSITRTFIYCMPIVFGQLNVCIVLSSAVGGSYILRFENTIVVHVACQFWPFRLLIFRSYLTARTSYTLIVCVGLDFIL